MSRYRVQVFEEGYAEARTVLRTDDFVEARDRFERIANMVDVEEEGLATITLVRVVYYGPPVLFGGLAVLIH